MTQQMPTHPRRTRSRAVTVAAVTAASALALTGLAARSAAPVVAAVTSETVTAVADTYVDSSRPTSNFGSRSTLYADGDPARALLVKFAIPATSEPISRATLRLYVSSSSAQGLTAAATPDVGWDEATVTWATAPGGTTQAGQVASVTAGTWATLDLTSAVSPGTTLTLRRDDPGSPTGGCHLAGEGCRHGATAGPGENGELPGPDGHPDSDGHSRRRPLRPPISSRPSPSAPRSTTHGSRRRGPSRRSTPSRSTSRVGATTTVLPAL